MVVCIQSSVHLNEGTQAQTVKPKLHIGLLFGGLSTEHEVSILSTTSIYEAIDKTKYDVSLIHIDKRGYWRLADPSALRLGAADTALRIERETDNTVFLSPAQDSGQLLEIRGDAQGKEPAPMPIALQSNGIDVIFPILHGPNGEDGTIQGLLKLVNIPFVGASVVGSVLGMDKDVMKRLLKGAGLPVPRFRVIRSTQRNEATFSRMADELGVPFFIKPANAGSSVGISKVSSLEECRLGMDEAFRFDNKILVEENVIGREIECAVIGNEHPIASVVGEIITRHAFYSYEAKYLDEAGTTLIIPADIPAALSDHIRDLSIKVYQTLCCEGMARVDMFLKENDDVLVNEINTIPGFTEQSMFPVLWDYSGLPLPTLIDRLIALALERHERDNRLQKTR